MKYNNYILFILLFSLGINFKSFSQLIIKPLVYNDFGKIFKLDNEELDTVFLPIFEDFSTYHDSITQNSIWSNTKSILIKDLPENKAPSLGVAVFDGINQYGIPYNESSEFVGLADSLSSNIINLGDYNGNQFIFFSFYWNINIFSEYPDENDSIRLQFLNYNEEWKTVWKKDGNTSIGEQIFKQEIINLNDQYLHKNFRFRFQNFGKLNGPFDSWVIDYIYLNNNRKSNDTIYNDRSLTYKPKNYFKNFTSIPIEQFQNDPDFFLDTIHVGLNNFNDQIQPLEYNCIVYDLIDKISIDTISWKEALDPLIKGFEKRIIFSNVLNKEKIPFNRDSINLKIKFYINSGDTITNGVEYRNNDTSEMIIKIKDYFSYDDGNAEYAAGINQEEGEVVVMYILNQIDTITHLEIFFPKIYPNSQNKKIELLLYKKLNNDRINLITNDLIDISNENRFNSYELISPLIVSDTIYVGYKQYSNEFIPIGLDKNNNNADKIFFNTNGLWEQNNLINGSLMIRPKFSKVNNFVTFSENKLKKISIKIYPNPTKGIIKINKKINNYSIYNLRGKLLMSDERETDIIDLKILKNGIYLLIIKDNDDFYSKKIIKYSKVL